MGTERKIYTGIVLFLGILGMSPVLGGNLFHEASELFGDGDYGGAAEVYEASLVEEAQAFGTYVNLGHSYSKNMEWGKAILAYAKALVIEPGHEGVEEYLAMAQKGAGLRAQSPSLLEQYSHLMGVEGWYWLLSACFWLLLGLFLLPRHYVSLGKLPLVGLRWVLAVGLVLAGVAMGSYHMEKDQAIIVKEGVELKLAPTDKSPHKFVLDEGQLCYIEDVFEGYEKVRLENGELGWVQNDGVREIWK